MRLTCPRCQAQYEIPEAVIPTSGREVECSACGQVWHQPGPGLPGRDGQIAAKSLDPAQVATPAAGAGFAAADRPLLSRKLDDDVLAILREEAERELSARAREGRGEAGQHHNPVTAPPDAGPAVPPPAADALGFDWPVTTVILPGEPLRDGAAAETPAEPVPEAAPQPRPEMPVAKTPAAPQPAEQPRPEPAAAKPARPADPPPLLPVEEPVASITDPEPEPDTPVPPRLPDAARLAATLTRALPQAAPEPSDTALPAAAPVPSVKTAVKTGIKPAKPSPMRSHPVPALRPRRGRAGYAAGFGLAAMLALALLGFYALAPRLEAGNDDSAVAQWRQGLDDARLWLHDSIGRIAGN